MGFHVLEKVTVFHKTLCTVIGNKSNRMRWVDKKVSYFYEKVKNNVIFSPDFYTSFTLPTSKAQAACCCHSLKKSWKYNLLAPARKYPVKPLFVEFSFGDYSLGNYLGSQYSANVCLWFYAAVIFLCVFASFILFRAFIFCLL
jgi:hypothetical protein